MTKKEAEIAAMKQQLEGVTTRLDEIEKERDQLREGAKPIIVKLLKAGVPPTEVADLSPFSDAWVRNYARANGVPPAARGRRRRDE